MFLHVGVGRKTGDLALQKKNIVAKYKEMKQSTKEV
jgi:hypothetical protein